MAREDKLRYQREVAEVEEKMRKADPREGE